MAWEKLLTAANDLEADMIAGLLKQAGIPTRYKYSGINSYLFPLTPMPGAQENRLATRQGDLWNVYGTSFGYNLF
ncbi:DUF2007 domain-containing protein [Desulfofundulus thermocisternus]|jgi:hypothetical protein|uniref:DUF2007 domain-containing protein n=1 Tax=Desulfofundulus thermocisternus TaxID=42471 RepID=UPI0019F7A0EC|nr:DUF2007 domain-containing protein [Desulfofundulus thermocisternus]MBE3585232.1 DUF2007 domain-containing protein [Thermoanaerobacter sp.]MCS5695214.1 DUF2007 domain-containing protein [Desulfofundulus thermocisternus]MDK2889284.1 hypothetical protein [Thermoanaerobacter sp.]